MSEGDANRPSATPGTKKPDSGDWPNTIRSRDQLDTALEAGLKSGPSKRSIDDIMEKAIARIENG